MEKGSELIVATMSLPHWALQDKIGEKINFARLGELWKEKKTSKQKFVPSDWMNVYFYRLPYSRKF